MKTRIFGLAAIIASAFLFAGCPYSSEVALSTEPSKIPAGIEGTWSTADNPAETIGVVSTDGLNIRVIKTTQTEGADPLVEKYTGFFTDINGTMFLNLREDSEYSSSYYIYKVQMNGENGLFLFEVTDNIREKFTSSAEMKTFFMNNMKNSYFYSSGEVNYTKTK